ncbi:MAG TPA: sigma 54-interacting transcriptional regulator [Balneolaceae bacterium]|nr:sigma 54-interacting transcriptional regulator [Balneolaceae bacterium]
MFKALPIDPHRLENSSLTPTEKSFESILMRDILSKVLDIAKLNAPVVIIGEMGVGKKRVAQIIHENSRRAAYPFYPFYCLDLNRDDYDKAFREQLMLSDDHFVLKYDVIEKAYHGILFLEQFSELSEDLMINIVQSFIKGCEQLYRFNAEAKPRLVISINMGSYNDLIHSSEWQKILNLLNPYTIMIPPLRERKRDIPLLINSFLKHVKSKSSKFSELSISEEALEVCASHRWPGNIKQLHNALLQGILLSHKKTIESQHFPFSMQWKTPYGFNQNNPPKNDSSD